MVVVVVVDMAASSTFPLYGWSIVSTLDTFQKSRNQKHKCSGWSFNEEGTMIHILWQATGSVLSYQSVKLVYCNLNDVCNYCLAVSQCVIPEHHSSPLTLKIIPNWARKFYLSETGLTGSNSQLDQTKRTAFPCMSTTVKSERLFIIRLLDPVAEKTSEHTELQAPSIFRFFFFSSFYGVLLEIPAQADNWTQCFFCLPSAIRFCPTHRVQDSTMTRSSAWLPIVEDDCHS